MDTCCVVKLGGRVCLRARRILDCKKIMPRITVFNQKGGVGKTTTALNLAAALARAGEAPLAIDLDPQAHLSSLSGLDVASGDKTAAPNPDAAAASAAADDDEDDGDGSEDDDDDDDDDGKEGEHADDGDLVWTGKKAQKE